MEETFRFEGLKVYQKSLDYIDFVHETTQTFPRFEHYELSRQFRRAASSVSLNIGEGEGGTTKEYIQFLRISRRSIRECAICTTIAFRRKYIDDATRLKSRSQLISLSKMTSGMINSLRNPK
jgi:four helix bundle protein